MLSFKVLWALWIHEKDASVWYYEVLVGSTILCEKHIMEHLMYDISDMEIPSCYFASKLEDTLVLQGLL